jgi:uncharacterized protein (TIGR02145 family)
MRTYYCVVSNGTDSVVSNYADVAVGCGAKTTDGNWLSFMCYNLGANTNLPPFVYYSEGDSTSFDIKGWLFQWGRDADGHQWRSSPTVAGTWDSSISSQVPSTSKTFYGRYITYSSDNNFDWRTRTLGTEWSHDFMSVYPCPSGWTVPTSSELASIFGARDIGKTTVMSASANTWLAVSGGVLILPNAADTTLFLPFNRARTRHAGALWTVPTHGAYWTASHGTSLPYVLYLDTTAVRLNTYGDRGHGRGLRCVKGM